MHMSIPKYWQTTEGIVLDFSLAISNAFSAAALGCLGTSSGVSVVSPASALATLAALLAALSRAAWAASETILLPFFGMRSTNGYEIHFTCKPFWQNIIKIQLDKKNKIFTKITKNPWFLGFTWFTHNKGGSGIRKWFHADFTVIHANFTVVCLFPFGHILRQTVNVLQVAFKQSSTMAWCPIFTI